jgi:hypothetical protein
VVERLYPVVYVDELSPAHPIDGVSTTSGASLAHASAAVAHEPAPAVPAWTDTNAHDPGVTLLQLMAWIGELTLFRAPAQAPHHRSVLGDGIVAGLGVRGAADEARPDVQVSPGIALDRHGRPIDHAVQARTRVPFDPEP